MDRKDHKKYEIIKTCWQVMILLFEIIVHVYLVSQNYFT